MANRYRAKKVKLVLSVGKVIASVFSELSGIIAIDCLTNGENITETYGDLLDNMD